MPSKICIEPGQILDADVSARNGRFLLPKGQTLTDKDIDVLLTWGVDEVSILNGHKEQLQASTQPILHQAEFSLEDLHTFSLHSQVSAEQENLTAMAGELPPQPEEHDFKGRIHYLEKAYHFALFALQQATALGDFQFSLSGRDQPELILSETAKRISNLIPFKSWGFFLMNEENSGFDATLIQPEDSLPDLNLLMQTLVRSGNIAQMIWHKRAGLINLQNNNQDQVIAHLISTTSRVRGLFLGFLQVKRQNIPQEALALLSNVLQNTANALESSELYAVLHRHNLELKAKVEEKTAELSRSVQKLQQEVAQRKTAQENLAYIFNNVHDAICIYRPDGTLIDVNAKMLSMFGLSREQALHMSFPADISCNRRNNDTSFETWQQVFNKGSHIFEWSALIANQDKVFPVEVYLKKISWNDQLAVLATLRDISQRKEAEKKLEFMAMHDPLTDLPNRKLFIKRLDQIIKQSRKSQCLAAILFIDLDGFKPVNDNYGHDTGDLVLKTVSARLSDILRKTDTVARLGGDEFGVVVSGLYTEKDHLVVMDKIYQIIRRPMTLEGIHVHLDCSIGEALFPRDGQDVDTLLKVADTQMYAVKRGKKN